MRKLILLVTFAIASQLVKGQYDPPPVGTVTCNANHTVDITISNVEDIAEWSEAEWRLESDAACEPTFSGTTVTYSGLVLPDCARKNLEVDNNVTIKYVLEISVVKTAGGGPGGQLRSYDHLYYVSCEYDNDNGTVMADFIPIVNKVANDSDNSIFTFYLGVFTDARHTTPPTNPIALNVPLYVWALVVTQSAAPNLDLFPVSCWASSSSDPMLTDNKVILITDGCGDTEVSEDYLDTLKYNCTDNSVNETFEIPSFRYYGYAEGSTVYFHCDLRVCMADFAPSACECPADPAACAKRRKRRSVGEYVEEFHVKSGPYYFADDKKDEVESEEQDELQSFSTNLVIIVAVSGVVVVAVCATVCFVVRNRNKRRQHGDLNVAA